MISCLRECLPFSGARSQWPQLHLAQAPQDNGVAVRWYATGRAALFQALRPLAGMGPGTALIPGYIAAGVIDPLRALGFIIEFYPTNQSLIPDLNALRRLLESNQKLKVLLILHPMGQVQDLEDLPELCRANGVILIEDCAQALFCSSTKGQPAGSQGDLALFSLTKHLGCLDGAAVVFRNHRLPIPEQPRRRPVPTRIATTWYGLHLALDRGIRKCRHTALAKGLLALTGHCYDLFYSRASRDFSPLAPSPLSARQVDGLDVPKFIAQRRSNVCTLYSLLHSPHLRFVYPLNHDGWVPMAVPAMVVGMDREDLVSKAMAGGIYLASLCGRWDHLPSGDQFSHEREYLNGHVLIPINEFISDEQMMELVDRLNTLC